MFEYALQFGPQRIMLIFINSEITSKSKTNNIYLCESCGKQMVKRRGHFSPSGCSNKVKN